MKQRKNSQRMTAREAKVFERVRVESFDNEDIISDYRGQGLEDQSRRVTWRYMALLGVALGVLITIGTLVGEYVEEFKDHRVSQRTLATVITIFLIFSVPVTHGHGLRKYASYQFWQPLKGGGTFVLLQAFGWSIYALALCLCFYMLYMGSAHYFKYVGLTGVVAQVCILVSLYYFSSPSVGVLALRRAVSAPSSPRATADGGRKRKKSKSSFSKSVSYSALSSLSSSSNFKSSSSSSSSSSFSAAATAADAALTNNQAPETKRKRQSAKEVKSSWASRFEVGAVICSVISFLLAVVMETHELGEGHYASLGTLSVTSILISVPFLHILAGPNRFEEYSVWQPFRGGFSFVWLQALAWTLWAFAVCASVLSIFFDAVDVWHLHYISPSLAGVVGVVSNVLLLLSLRVFDTKLATTLCSMEEGVDYDSSAGYFREPISRRRVLKQLVWLVVHDMWVLCMVTAFYCAPMLAIASVVTHACALLLAEYGWLYVGVSFAVYAMTFKPGHRVSGTRIWPQLRDSAAIWDAFEDYFNLSVIPEGKLQADENYLFAFHPHGLLPGSAVFGTLGSQWRRYYGHIRPISVCGASMLFYLPVIRDILSWCGCRDVTKSAIRHGLEKQDTSILLIPGGQREMRESRPDKESMVLCVRHKGFIRMALRTGKKLVPILSFGEDQILRNVYVPGVQAYTLARIGVALPVYIMGRWFSPIPNKVDVTMVIGEPISVPLDLDPSTELINTLHEQYYSQIRHMFDAHKERAGFPDCQLTFMTH